jgi:D-alanyl-D-alanine carboxypeptidase
MKRKLLLVLSIISLSFFTTAQTFDPGLAARLQYVIDSMRTANNVKGISACVIRPGMGVWKGTTGVSHAGTPMTSDMEFGIASNTKLFTGVLILKLAENNLLDLDDSLYEFLPSFDNIDSNITIRQLLNHTTGLDDVTSVPGYPDSMLTDPNRIFTAAELMTWAGPPLFSPGTGWSYCNTNYLLAGMIAENVTGQSYGRLLRDSILVPLQLDSTFLDVYDSVLYTIAHPWQNGFDNVSIPRKSVNSAAWSAGAMYSTSGEMAEWYRALMNGEVLDSVSFSEMTTFVGSGDYGIGISRAVIAGRTVWQHGGSIWGGYNSSMMYDTASGAVVCVLINQFPAQAFQVSIRLILNVVNSPVGIGELPLDNSDFPVYPNPADGLVRIDLPGQSVRSIRLVDPAGRMLKESFQTEIDVTGLPSGICFVNVVTDKGAYTRKLVIGR